MNRECAKDARKSKKNPLHKTRYVFRNGTISQRVLGPVMLKLVTNTFGELSTRIDLPDGYVLGGYLHRGDAYLPYIYQRDGRICKTEIEAILAVVSAAKNEKEKQIKMLDRISAIWGDETCRAKK